MQSQSVLQAAPSADGNLAYAPPAPAALLLLRDHIICFWLAFNICQKTKDPCKIFCSGMEANTFSSPWKMCPCTRIIKYHTPCYHKQILLGRPLVSDLDWYQGLVNWSFSIDPDGFWMRPHQRHWRKFKQSLMNNKGIPKCLPPLYSCLSQETSLWKRRKVSRGKAWGDKSSINAIKI